MIDFFTWLKLKNLTEDLIPGDSPPEKQVHVFDFDDTLGIATNSNGVMLYIDGKPAHKTPYDVISWLTDIGIKKSDIISGPDGDSIKYIPSRRGYAGYVTSGALTLLRKKYKDKEFVTGSDNPNPKGDGEEIVIDYTPSSNVNPQTTIPIKNTIEKLKSVNAAGGKTMVMTARRTQGTGTSIEDKKVVPSNAEDIDLFLQKNNAKPNSGVVGVLGQDKGDEIKKRFIGYGNEPEEIHFYDDLEINTNQVAKALKGDSKKVDSELHIYGPGEFAHGGASPFRPTKSFQ
jgi:hypothetical protein